MRLHHLNKVEIIAKSLTLHNIDLLCRYTYYQVLYSRYYYLMFLILMLKKLYPLQFFYSVAFKKRRVYTILRSPFIHKKSREQFEHRIFKRQINFCGIFNTRYAINVFNNNWKFLCNLAFKNTFIKVKLRNRYYLFV